MGLLLMHFDANGLYLSAMSVSKSVHHKIESGYAFTTDTNDELVYAFNNQSFTKSSAIL